MCAVFYIYSIVFKYTVHIFIYTQYKCLMLCFSHIAGWIVGRIDRTTFALRNRRDLDPTINLQSLEVIGWRGSQLEKNKNPEQMVWNCGMVKKNHVTYIS